MYFLGELDAQPQVAVLIVDFHLVEPNVFINGVALDVLSDRQIE